MLTASHVTKEFGGLTAVDDVDLTIDTGEIVGLIGPNGAGKTTLFNTITGVHHATSGSVTFNDEEITDWDPHEVAQFGIMRTFQEAKTFNESSVLDNVTVGALFGNGEIETREDAAERAAEELGFVGLEDLREEAAGSLTLADRKLLELARALAADPSLILADEIGAGLTPSEIDEMTEMLLKICDERDISVFWIEHVMDAILNAADRIIVLNRGSKIADGPPEEVRRDEDVAEAYLGEID